MQIGDSSGMLSPLSFGGFGALVRHLVRLTTGLNTCLKNDFLDKPVVEYWVNHIAKVIKQYYPIIQFKQNKYSFHVVV